jgi:hypothetical protein
MHAKTAALLLAAVDMGVGGCAAACCGLLRWVHAKTAALLLAAVGFIIARQREATPHCLYKAMRLIPTVCPENGCAYMKIFSGPKGDEFALEHARAVGHRALASAGY